MQTIRLNPWVKCLNPSPSPTLRLFCFPYAGGGSAIFRPWLPQLPDPTAIEICTIQLPGREERFREPPLTCLATLVQTLSQELCPYLDVPFTFFGHSMGALIGFELANYLQAHQNPMPIHLFVSGCPSPRSVRKKGRYTLSDQDLLTELQHLKGTPQQVLENPELMQMLLPTLRADFTLCETYAYSPQEPLTCGISVFGGLQDAEAPLDSLFGWSEHTCISFSQYFLPGEHFFLHSHYASILEVIIQQVS